MKIKEIIKKSLPENINLKLYRYKKRLSYVGFKVKCPICHSYYKKFKPYGPKRIPNIKCHNCGSQPHHRLLWLYLEKKSILNNGHIRILHFAPEQYLYDLFCQNPTFDYFPVDIEPELYNYSGSVKLTKADITDIPFSNNNFDLIICSHVLEHIPDDKRAMSELFRVMDNNGIGIFQVPLDNGLEKTYEDFSITDPKEREVEFGQFDHVRVYGRDYPNRLRSVGFKVFADDFISSVSPRKVSRYGLKKGEIIYKCLK